jgi:hypothetical protein
MKRQTRTPFAGPATWRPFPIITVGCVWSIALIGARYASRQKPIVDIGAQVILTGILVVSWIWLDRQRADSTLRRIFLAVVAGGIIISYCVNGDWWSLCYDALIVATSWKYFIPDSEPTRAFCVRASVLAGTVEYESMRFPGVFVEEYSSDWTRRLSDVRTDADGRFSLPSVSGGRIHHIKVSWPGTRTVYLNVEMMPEARPLLVRLKPGKPKAAGDWGEWAA